MTKTKHPKLKTCTKPRARNPIHPIAIALSELYLDTAKEGLPTTMWCIDLARTAITYEQIAQAEGKSELFVENMVRQKIERDKGVKIR